MCASCPSPTPCGLGLGPTDPGTINVAQETLDLRRAGFSPTLTLPLPAFSLLQTPHRPFLLLSPPYDSPPPIPSCASTPRLLMKYLNPAQFCGPSPSPTDV